jgi:hypothetical protein
VKGKNPNAPGGTPGRKKRIGARTRGGRLPRLWVRSSISAAAETRAELERTRVTLNEQRLMHDKDTGNNQRF